MTMVAGAPEVTTPVDRSDELKASSEDVRWLNIQARLFVALDGSGPVGPATFTERMPGLYTAVYSIHFALKRRGLDERVWPLELLMWTAGRGIEFDAADRTDWQWRLMIGLPDGATNDELASAIAAGQLKVSAVLGEDLRVMSFAEGNVAQIMHIGPYSEERPTIERLHAAISEAGCVPTGAHHEIYLGNPQRSAPERLRTIIRQPFIKG